MTSLADETRKQTLFILDQGLKDHLGHYFEYTRSIAECALRRDFACVVASNQTTKLPRDLPFLLVPSYSGDVWDTIAGKEYKSSANVDTVSARFIQETRALFAVHAPQPGDVIFMPNIAAAHTLAIADLTEQYGSSGIYLYFMFRYPSRLIDCSAARRAFRRVEMSDGRRYSIFCTDSHRLAAELSPLTSIPFRVLPIPHTDHIAKARELRAHGPIHFVSLGNARGEKGLGEIFAAIRMSALEPWGQKARFTLQVNDPSKDIAAAIAAFRRDPDPRVTLIEAAMDSSDYYALLRDADCVLVPYHRGIYRQRTSGVFLEGVMAGKILVCTQDTWMSDLLEKHGGGIVVPDKSPEHLCSAIRTIIQSDNAARLAGKAAAAAAYWSQVHTPDNLVAELFRDAGAAKRPKAVIFFPWADALYGATGAAQRLRMLVMYLENIGCEVKILFLSYSDQGGVIGSRSVAYPYHMSRLRNRVLIDLVARLARLLGDKSGATSVHLSYHLWPHFDGRLKKRCEDLIIWADHVFLEYSYLAPVVGHLCEKHRKSYILTQHDILSDQLKRFPLIQAACRRLEFSALVGAPRVAVPSVSDAEKCSDRGVSSTVIPHPVDLDGVHPVLSADESRFLLGAIYRLDLDAKRVCIFVGSRHDPNIRAAEFVCALAHELTGFDGAARDVFFIVVGGCMEPCRTGNFAALGIVDDDILATCYAAADVVLVPLTEGTGTSVKAIEALARGAVVLSTSVGVRGLAVRDGTHCLIENDFGRYAQRILTVLSSNEAASKMRAAARQFGASYDYRVVFSSYAVAHAPIAGVPHANGEAQLLERRRRTLRELLPIAARASAEHTLEALRERFGEPQNEPPLPACDTPVAYETTTVAELTPLTKSRAQVWLLLRRIAEPMVRLVARILPLGRMH